MDIFLHDSVELLREMVRIPSVSFEEDGVCSHIIDRLNSWGVDTIREKNNIIALCSHFDPAKKTLCLDAHIDTVPANNGYTFDPHDPGDDPSVVRGLGSNDDGGSVAAMVAVFRKYRESTLPFNLMLTLTAEEERSGCEGIKWLYDNNGPLGGGAIPTPDFIIVGEPTQMRAATSERGLLVLDGEARGVSGHAARNEGVNALYIALEDIQALRAHRFEKISERMGEVKLSVTQIQAGTAHNVVPDLCSFVVDIRPTDRYTNEEILEELQALCRSTLTPRNLKNRSSATKVGSPLLKVLDALGIEQFSSPTTSNWIRIPCDAVKMGPGDSSRSHRPDEYILVDEIDNAIKVYSELIETLSANGNTLE